MQEKKDKNTFCENNIRIVALDLDGTTFNSKGQVSDRTRNALETAAKQGVHVVVSTGRSYNSLPEQIKSVKGIEYAITSNGAHINDIATGESIYDSYLSERAVNAVAEMKDRIGCGLEVFVKGQAYMDTETFEEIRQFGSKYRNAEYILWSRKPTDDIISFMKDNKNIIENINLCFNGPDHLEEHRSEVEAIPEATITSSFPNNLEVGGPNTSKKSALVELLGRLSISPENLMCCGDAPNDIQMLEYAGIGVAMGNAWGGTKDHADYVTATNDEDGVAQAFEKFVLK